MTFKSIIVHADDPARSAQRVDVAARIARRFESRLVAICSLPRLETDVELAELSPGDVARRVTERERRDELESMLRRSAASLGLADVELRVLGSHPLDAALAEMRCADLSILGQPDVGNGSDFTRQLAENAVLGNGGPVLLVPYAPSTVELGENIVVAWDGGREAARAVRDALPLLAGARRVTVLSLGSPGRASDAAAASQARLARYLSAYAVEAGLRSMPCTTHDAAELLLSQVADLGSDLVVMGAYGHARVRELILGGVTRTMLERMTVPVLMSH